MMKKIAALLLALVCSYGSAQGLDSMSPEGLKLFNQANQLVLEGKLSEAFKQFIAASKVDPGSSLPLSGLARAFLVGAEHTQGETSAKLRQQAEAAARQALQKHGDDPVAQEVLRLLGDSKPLLLHQPTPEAAAALHEGELLFNQRKLDEALVQYERAAALDPQFSTAWIYAGDCYFVQKKYAEAEQRFRKGVEVEPLNAQGWRFLADALMGQDKPGPASGALMGGIAAQPSQLPNWVKLNQIRTLSGFPLTPLNLTRKSRGELDPASKKINITVDPSLNTPDMSKSADGTLWMLLATAEALNQQPASDGKPKDGPFATELAAWRLAFKAVDDAIAKGSGELKDPALKTLQTLAKADQLEPALLLLQYKESWRPEFEAWKAANPDGVRQFIDRWQLRP
ncbi:tetratricopeptide repeat protein [Duganella sp. FT80W]|uniref:Tetratricopeptide repeat protein n=1 Tax=Duganella guangzhouensis TaxID=2666084 RepID=A0A6I2KX44_9BURK|nr:tetratricopeptide repeat protein [Duganella guangzhouensis]MRW90100.1 tetratricopeptide repeat protein [Duganella guangzhouensis]